MMRPVGIASFFEGADAVVEGFADECFGTGRVVGRVGLLFTLSRANWDSGLEFCWSRGLRRMGCGAAIRREGGK